MADILKVAQSGLTAAQIGLTTTGHNIANANTPGYNRQIVVQNAATAQNLGFGFVGNGTEITNVSRVYNAFLVNQANSAQTSSSQLDTYYSQISQINNMLGDSTSGLSPAMQDFFGSLQTASTDPNSAAARQTLLSSGQTLASRFQALSEQLSGMQQGVNTQIAAGITDINSYATQIAALNDQIGKVQASSGAAAPNDLLDQRDQLIASLSKDIKVSVVQQNNSYNVFIGNGQPLVVGTTTFNLVGMNSPTDPSRLEVGYQNGSKTTMVDESILTGGSLSGLLQFRSQSLDVAQNSLGRIAITLGTTFNAQHKLGQDQNGAMGGDFFTIASPQATSSSQNTGTGVLTASISNANALTTSDYSVRYDASAAKYTVTRLSDGATNSFATFPQTIDGIDFKLASGTVQDGDSFLVKPTALGATNFGVAISDTSKIALAAPVTTSTVSGNTGSATISAGKVNASTLISPVTLNYNSVSGALSGFPSGMPIIVTSGGVSTTYPAGTASVPYASGDSVSFGGVNLSGIPTASSASYTIGPPNATLTYSSVAGGLTGFPPYMDVTATVNGVSTTYPAGTTVPYTPPNDTTLSFGGVSVTVSGTPANGDSFKVAGNTSGVGDNRNALLLAALQSSTNTVGGTLSYQGAYSQMVNTIGNKTRELQVTSTAADSQYQLAVQSQQSESGVNLDEEATNMLRYQQAYQAAARVMQTASKLFDTLLSLGS
jgi:flagellar hook-associated protein 1 FlgK